MPVLLLVLLIAMAFLSMMALQSFELLWVAFFMYDLARLDITMPIARSARWAFAFACLAGIFAMSALTIGFVWNNPSALIAGADVVWLFVLIAFAVLLALLALLSCIYALFVMWLRGYRGIGRVLFAAVLVLGLCAYPALLLSRWHKGDQAHVNSATQNFTASQFDVRFAERAARFLPTLPAGVESMIFQPVLQSANEAVKTPEFERLGEPILIPLALDEAFEVVQQSLLLKGYWISRAAPPPKQAAQKPSASGRAQPPQPRKGGANAPAVVAPPVPSGQNSSAVIEASLLSPLLLFRDIALVRLIGRGQSTEVNVAFVPRFAWSDFGTARPRLDALRETIKTKVDER